MLRTAIYARVSTKNQEVETQLQELRDYIGRRSDLKLTEEFVDVCSGSQESRKQLDALMTAAAQRKLDAVVFWDLSRLTRRGIFHALQVLNQWQEHGVKAICYGFPNLDFTDAFTGQLMASFLAWFSEQEREMLRRRVQAGIDQAKRNGTRSGKPIGRPPLPEGVRSKVLKLRKEGRSLSEIAKAASTTRRPVSRSVVVKICKERSPD